MFKKKKGFFSKMFRKAGMSSGVTITVISIAAIGIVLYGASHFSKTYDDGKFLSELPHIKTSAELLEKARSYDYNYVGYNNTKSVDNMIKQIKNATPNVWNMVGDSNNNGNTDSSTDNDGNRIVIYNPDVSGSGDLTQNDNDVLEKTKGYIIFLKNKQFPKELAGLYKYYSYSGYNVYSIKTNGGFVPLTLGNAGTSFTKSSDSICNATGDDYGLSTGSDDTYSRIIHLKNTEDPDCVYMALHDKDNFASDVKFVLDSDLDFSGVNMDYSDLNNNLDLEHYKTGGNTFLPIGGNPFDDHNYNIAGGSFEFDATFSGNNHKIIIGNISYSNKDYIGFFGYIGRYGKVSDLKIKIGNISGNHYVGGFVGWNRYGTVSNSLTDVNSLSGNSSVGGFAGGNDLTINNSSAVVKFVNGNNNDVGGFVGENNGIITNSSAVVKFVSGDGGSVGGFVGYNDSAGTIENSSTVANTVNGNSSVGGFVGGNYNGTISYSSAVADNVSSSNDNDIGGFVGDNDGGIISNSLAVVDTVNSSENYVGGFAGDNYNSGTIENSSAVVDNVIGRNGVGGFVGYDYNGTISNSSVVADNISGNENYVGGFVGSNGGTIEKSSAVVKFVSGDGGSVGGFVGENNGIIENSSAVADNVIGKYDHIGGLVGYNGDTGTYTGSVARILYTGDDNAYVTGGYYYYSGDNIRRTSSDSSLSNITAKDQFFFDDDNRKDDGLEYTGNDGGGTLTITAPTDKEFNVGNFNSAFNVNNDWGDNHILYDLNDFWNNKW